MAGATFSPGRCEPQTVVGATAVGDGGRCSVPPGKCHVHCAAGPGAFDTSGANGTAVAVSAGVARTSQAPVTSLLNGAFVFSRSAP